MELQNIATELVDKNKVVRKRALERLSAQIASTSPPAVGGEAEAGEAEAQETVDGRELFDQLARPVLSRLGDEHERSRELAAAIVKQMLGHGWWPPDDKEAFFIDLLHTMAARLSVWKNRRTLKQHCQPFSIKNSYKSNKQIKINK